MTNGLRNHPRPERIRTYADEQRYNRRHRLFWRWYVSVAASAALIAIALWAAGYHIVWKPTPDQLYGCTVAQQAPNGECQ